MGIASRIVTATDAEDVVQEAWLRWNSTDRTIVRSTPAFLSRTTARLSITMTRTAYARYQTAAGLQPGDAVRAATDPAELVENAEQLLTAMAVLVTRLDKREQVAFILREAFDLPYRNIGELLGLSEPNARQLIRRARVRLVDGRGRQAPPVERFRLFAAFLDAAHQGDLAPLAELARKN
ncbi:RNA polymerase sigma-70 factor (ECF subfamily) [Nonomuraea rubra]|uniref:RNA polymerase sigma-70 factor (ECF subfamily) n=1 Tax=Nonomuraea rubra TaxID=46180 RepID=A0A7X0NV59_9ACTN|nr:RNA polymerase sigma-70 factor (ECF subfamily) [Nonomuraea rubra]